MPNAPDGKPASATMAGWAAITHAGRLSERDAVQARLAEVHLSEQQRERVLARARDLVAGCRARTSERSTLDLFLQEFGLSNEEGIALMCITTVLLLDPDRRKKAIAVALIAPLACGGLPASATHTQNHTPDCYERGLVPGWTPGSCITRFEQDVTLCDVSRFLSNTATLFGTASLFLSFTGFGGAFTGGIALVFGAMAIGTTLAGACSFESPPFEP